MRYLLTALFVLPAIATAQQLHTFKNDEVADADKVNENFTTLLSQTEALEARVADLESSSTPPTPDTTLRVSLETPVSGDAYTGIGTLSGWALADSGIERIEIHIDGQFAFDVAYGNQRSDVGNVFPEIDNSSKSGFSTRYNFSNLTPGEHTVTVVAISKANNSVESSSQFNTTRFSQPFISDGAVSLDAASCQLQAEQITILDAEVAGSTYTIKAKWKASTQDFDIIEIN